MRIARFFQTTTFRWALLYATLFCASVLALYVAFYWTTTVLIERQRAQIILSDAAGLTDQFAGFGPARLADVIVARTQPERVGDRLYLLTDRTYAPIVGNMSAWPRSAVRSDNWLRFPIERVDLGESEPQMAEALHVVLPGQYHLLVGLDTRAEKRFSRALLEALAWSLAIMIGLGVAVGLLMSRRVLSRIDGINRAAERIMRGEVRHRMPVGPAGDEFDRLAENLNAMLEEIARLMGSMREVTSNIAHDLRSPLTRVRNRLEAALAGGDDPARRREAIEQSLAEADELLKTFNALLSIADAEAGAGRAERSPVDLAELARDLAELYEPAAEERGLRLERQLAGPAVVTGNRQLLFQVLANLLDNAIKHAVGGTRILLAVDLAGPTLTVADDGPGVPEADRERVLERFVRLDSSRSTPGSGLGLSLVSAIAHLHGATLALDDNRPGLRVVLRFGEAAELPAAAE